MPLQKGWDGLLHALYDELLSRHALWQLAPPEQLGCILVLRDGCNWCNEVGYDFERPLAFDIGESQFTPYDFVTTTV